MNYPLHSLLLLVDIVRKVQFEEEERIMLKRYILAGILVEEIGALIYYTRGGGDSMMGYCVVGGCGEWIGDGWFWGWGWMLLLLLFCCCASCIFFGGGGVVDGVFFLLLLLLRRLLLFFRLLLLLLRRLLLFLLLLLLLLRRRLLLLLLLLLLPIKMQI